MIRGGTGGARTKTGLSFESKTDVRALFDSLPGYSTRQDKDRAGVDVLFDGRLVARCFKKNAFYAFLDEIGVDWQNILSRKLLPDDALLVVVRETLFIIEVKYQQVPGSVDEKLQTCDFKRKQYQKLLRAHDIKVEYVYVLNDWFKSPGYRDVLEYISSVNCHYKFNELPLAWLGLPAADATKSS